MSAVYCSNAIWAKRHTGHPWFSCIPLSRECSLFVVPVPLELAEVQAYPHLSADPPYLENVRQDQLPSSGCNGMDVFVFSGSTQVKGCTLGPRFGVVVDGHPLTFEGLSLVISRHPETGAQVFL